MKIKKVVAAGAAAVVAIAGVAFATTAAHADPVSGGYSIVGSDTLQDAVSALANGTNITGPSIRVSGDGKDLASWDAFTLGVSGGVGKIQTKPFGPIFDRPNGSGAGRNALLASLNGTNYGTPGVNIANQVDLARSSSLSSTTGTTLTYIPFGQDAISYIYKVGTASAGNQAAAAGIIDSLSKAQLTSIYNAVDTTAASAVLSGTGYTLQPLALQSSSGTWTTFLGKIGVTTVGAAVNSRSNTIAENDGTALTPGTDTIQIIPVSAANYIGQVNGAARTNTMTSVSMGAIDNVYPYTGTAPALAPNAAYYTSADWGRTVYIVVPTVKITPGNAAYDAGLSALVDTSSTTSLTYWGASGSPTTTKAVKIKFGFSAPTGTVQQRGA
jgi:hypothetical protein